MVKIINPHGFFHQVSFALASCVLLQHQHGVDAYQLLINDSSVDGASPFYQELHSILDENTSVVVGEMYQDYIYNANGTTRVGTHQGFAFNFDNSTQFNSNGIFFLDDGEINSMNDGSIIVSATGAWEKYQYGTMPNWKVLSTDYDAYYAAEILLVEPEKADAIDAIVDADEDTNENDSIMSFRVTSEGGYYTAIMNGQEGKQIGQVFQNPITFPNEDGNYDQNSSSVGINQGYSFNFPDDPHPMGNRQLLFGKDDKMIVFNEIVMHATGPYAKFIGSTLSEEVVSNDPNYVADITVAAPTSTPDTTGNDVYIREEGATYDFRITANGGFYDPIQSVNGEGTLEQIGERFQNPVYTYSGNRVGTNQGYAFIFPVTNFTREMTMGNRVFPLQNGTLNVFNEIIVKATGIYSEFTGGRFKEVIVSENPDFVSEITLIPPSVNQKEEDDGAEKEDNVESAEKEGDGNEGASMTSGGDSVLLTPTLFGLGVVLLQSMF